MKTLLAFLKKEWLEQFRSGRVIILTALFVLFGIMNPALAKLTPKLFELMADTLEESGMIVTTVTVDAMTSWTQFFKNIPIALIVFVLLESSIFTKEYQSGTLVLALTKGLERYKVVLAKTAVLTILWSAGYFLCFAITYGYNAYFWDNSIAHNLLFSVSCWWLLGMLAVMLSVLFSVLANANTGVLVGTGGTFLAAYLMTLLPKIKVFSPARLMSTASLLTGAEKVSSCYKAVAVTAILCVTCIAVSIPIHNKKRI
ncbi:MAG: ABC transporter permease subunit [Lachnospiraceae bacterium]|nr:ABC transporter permease subunit [Lachnospiraceae bacterium]